VNLQEFVAQTLIEIAAAVREADEELKASGAIVNPRSVIGAGQDKANVYGYIEDRDQKKSLRAVHSVEFDVAVTAVEGKESKGGIGIVVGSIGLGSQGRSEESSSSVSRIKFKVPIALPNSVDES
jgi:hypothetical protein